VQQVETTSFKTILFLLLVILFLPIRQGRAEIYLLKVTVLILITVLYPVLGILLIAQVLIRGTFIYPEVFPLIFLC
jgi:hypothetical protein